MRRLWSGKLCFGVSSAIVLVTLLPTGCVGAGLIGLPEGGESSDSGERHDGGGANDATRDATAPMDATSHHDAFTPDVALPRDVVSQDVGEDVTAIHDAGHDAVRDAEYDVATAHDGGHDAGLDGGHDAGLDGGHDAGLDGGHDAGHDSGHDAGLLCGTQTCTPTEDCVGSQCVACTPSVTAIAQSAAPPLPPGGTGGLKVSCGDPGNGYSAPCPVVVCGVVNYWFFSDNNNDEELFMVGYYPGDTVYSGPVTIFGNRYVDTVTVDTADQDVSITGQDGATTTEPYSFFQ